MSLAKEASQAVFQKARGNSGGIRFMFGTFCDIARANKATQDCPL